MTIRLPKVATNSSKKARNWWNAWTILCRNVRCCWANRCRLLCIYPQLYPQERNAKKIAKPIAQISEVNEPETPSSLHENSDNVLLNAMGFSPIHPDLLAENLNLPAADVYAELTELELDGWIVSMAGGRFQRVK